MSPKVRDPKNTKGYLIVINTDDHWPPHVHVVAGRAYAKLGFAHEVYLIENKGFTEGQLRDALDLVWENRGHCWQVWVNVFGQPSQEELDSLKGNK